MRFINPGCKVWNTFKSLHSCLNIIFFIIRRRNIIDLSDNIWETICYLCNLRLLLLLTNTGIMYYLLWNRDKLTNYLFCFIWRYIDNGIWNNLRLIWFVRLLICLVLYWIVISAIRVLRTVIRFCLTIIWIWRSVILIRNIFIRLILIVRSLI